MSITDVSLADFYPKLYLSLHEDLRDAFGTDHVRARDHYKKYGLKEGRVASPFFSPKFYLERYSDLRRAFGNDYKKALFHWIDHGIEEGRQGSALFDVHFYLHHHNDLLRAYGRGNYHGAFYHYKKHGFKEGRMTSVDNNGLAFSLGEISDPPSGFGPTTGGLPRTWGFHDNLVTISTTDEKNPFAAAAFIFAVFVGMFQVTDTVVSIHHKVKEDKRKEEKHEWEREDRERRRREREGSDDDGYREWGPDLPL